jgi:hypothetical protein
MRDLGRLKAVVAVAAAAGLLATIFAVAPAFAKSKRTASYKYELVWPAAVRHLRVSEGFKITEKDNDAGYVIFEFEDDGDTYSGAFELIRTKDFAGRQAVDMALSMAGRPSYMELGVLDRLLQKLRDELGNPPRVKKPPKKKPEKEEDGKGKDSKDGKKK